MLYYLRKQICKIHINISAGYGRYAGSNIFSTDSLPRACDETLTLLNRERENKKLPGRNSHKVLMVMKWNQCKGNAEILSLKLDIVLNDDLQLNV